MTGRLAGRLALVTGSTGGIGWEIARGFAGDGAHVVLNGRGGARLEEARARLISSGVNPALVNVAPFDVADEGEVAEGVARVASEVGAVDILVNNAGMQRRAPLTELAVEAWREVLEVNLTGAFLVGRAVAGAMIEAGRGKIINICSVQTSIVRPTTGAYAASKGGLANLTRAMCAEWAPHGLQVNGLAPGYIDTPLNSALTSDPVFSEWIVGRTPARRWGTVADIVGPAIWLASDDAAFVNGQIIYVDGGLTSVI